MRRLLFLLLCCIATMPTPAARAAVPVLVIEGRGHGHGVGMAQDGAFWMAKSGATTPEILGHFYPGTGLGKAGGEVRVVVLPPVAENEAVVAFPSGGQVRDAREGTQSPGFPVDIPAGGQVRMTFDGSRYRVEPVTAVDLDDVDLLAQQVPPLPGDTTTTTGSTTSTSSTTTTTRSTTTTTTSRPTTSTSSTTTTTASSTETSTSTTVAEAPSSTRSLWAVPKGAGTVAVPTRQRQYRGLVEATASGSPLRLVNHLDVETYARGMGEVRDPAWPPAALRAQAIAVRTYALRAMSRGGELCDSQRCQVYLGTAGEYRAMDKAVAETRGQVLLYAGALASAVYSSNGGGVSATQEEGFGTPETDTSSYPYLRSAPYTTQDVGPWRVEVALADLVSRLGYKGELAEVRVKRTGPSGRVLEVAFDGEGRTRTLTGIVFDRALGLRSTLFTLRMGTAETAPSPPWLDGEQHDVQELPELAAAVFGGDDRAADTPDAPATAVPHLPDAPRARRVIPPPAEPRSHVPLVVTASWLLGFGLVATAWGVVRRAGLAGRVLGF
jgi:SpoIID/LytB domain protein